jgi:hypothetical protein
MKDQNPEVINPPTENKDKASSSKQAQSSWNKSQTIVLKTRSGSFQADIPKKTKGHSEIAEQVRD